MCNYFMNVLKCYAITQYYCRYGKFVVLDLLDIEDMWPVVQHKFDVVQKDLLSNLMSKQLLKEEK